MTSGSKLRTLGGLPSQRMPGFRPDLLLLDLGLPDLDGLQVIREMRSDLSTPIVGLSARGAERDKVQALDLGADDYLTHLLAASRPPDCQQAHRARHPCPRPDYQGSSMSTGEIARNEPVASRPCAPKIVKHDPSPRQAVVVDAAPHAPQQEARSQFAWVGVNQQAIGLPSPPAQ